MATASADAEAAAARINQEQLLHEMEHKYLMLKADFAVLEQERDFVLVQKNEAATQIKSLQTVVLERDTEIVKTKDELLQLRTTRDQLGFQIKAATSQADRRLNDLEDLQQMMKEQSKQLMDSQRKEVEALQKAAEQESHVEPLRHSVNRLTQELATNKQHLEWMEKQLTEKTKLIQELRQSSAKISHAYDDMNVTHTEELASVRKQLDSARQISKKLESSLVQAKEHVKEVQAARAHEEERLQNELSAQRRLADLYKDSAEDANTRVNELQEICETLRRSLAESEDALAHQEERTKQQVEHIFREQAAASERRIQELQGELKDSQERLEELQKNKMFSLQTASAVASMSSAAGAAHLAAHGLTPKELCDQILALETELRGERDEKEQLKICMDRVVKEVHEKAPMIMELKLNLERAVASNAHVSERYELCKQELAKCRAREHHIVKDKQSYERKCEALAKSVDDLSRQVQHLLFRAHESSQTRDHAAPGESVSENLVVFKDVEELQIRNQQLLMVIREITESKKKNRGGSYEGDSESAHMIVSGESDGESDDGDVEMSSSIGKRLAAAQKELGEMRGEREEERQMIAAVVKQRDMYRVLLQQADSKYGQGGEPRGSAPTSDAGEHHHRRSPMELTETRALRELQKEFETYKKEKQANMKMLQDTLDHARSESNAFRLAQMQAEVEAKCHKDRLDAADKRRHDSDEEILRLRAKSDQVNSLLIQHQKLLSENEFKLEAAVTRLRALEVEKDGALREVAFMKKNESKALQELAAMRLDNTNLLKLMDTTRQIESSREEREQRGSERINQKLATLEAKLQEAYDKLESNEAVAGAKIAAEEQAKKIATTELAEAKEQLATAREQLARLEEQATAATSQNAQHEKEVSYLREQLRKGASVAVAERVAALEVQLRQSQREVQSALEMKKSLTEAVTKYKAIAEANEKSLSELSNASEQWKAEHMTKITAIQGERDAARAELEKIRARINDDVTEGNKLREEMDEMVRAHQIAIKQSEDKQRQLQMEANAARTELASLQEEVGSLREDVTTAQENYERELKLHASQVEKYSQSRKLLQDEQKKTRALLGEMGELKARVMVAEKEAADKVASVEKLMADADHSKSSLVEQNKLLHSQLERANHQLRRTHEAQMIKSIGESSTVGSGASAGTDGREHAKEVDELRSVIAFVRKEGEILSSKYELVHQENLRYRTQVSMLEATIERLRDEIKRVEEGSSNFMPQQQVGAPSDAAKQAAKLEQLDLLRESNATLREECQKNLARVQTEEQRVKNLEAQLVPLRSSEALLKAQIESLKQEIGALSDANKRWKQRVEQLVEKYQQIDPAEYEKVCAEKAAAVTELAELQAKETALRAEVETLKSSEGKNVEEEKGKSESLRKQYDRIKGFAKTWKTKAEAFQKTANEKTKEAEDKSALLVVCEKKLEAAVSEKAALVTKISSLDSTKTDMGTNAAAASAAMAAATTSWEKERQEIKDRAEAETKRVGQLKEMNAKLINGLKNLKQENSQLKTQLSAKSATPIVTEPMSDITTTTPVAPVSVTTAAQPAPALIAVPSAPVPPATTAKATQKPTLTATAPAFVPVSTTAPAVVESKSSSPAVTPLVPAPAKSPPRTPAPTPTLVPTLKAVTAPAATPAGPIIPPARKAVVPVVTVPPSPAKAETKQAAAPVAGASAATPAQPSAEEKLRLFALQSMKKQFLKPAGTTPTKPSATSVNNTPIVTPTAAAKPPLPPLPPATTPAKAVSTPAPPSTEEEKSLPPSADNAGPFLKLSPPSGSFGAFGSGGASGLVFGKPGITLPIPASPTPTAVLAVATGSAGAATPVAFATPSPSVSSPDGDAPVVSGETEAQRRSQRLARFGLAAAAAAAADLASAASSATVPAPGAPTLKRPATAAPDSATTAPPKMARRTPAAPAAITMVVDSQETEDDADDQVSAAEDSEATEDEIAAMASSPPTPDE